MRYFLLLLLFAFSFSAVSGQTREEAVKELGRLKERGRDLESIILRPDEKDIESARRENVNVFSVFRILPREKYEKVLLETRGGGGYYSFVMDSHSYDDTPQIELADDDLSVGFYGASYGFMTDLGEFPLAEIDKQTSAAAFLLNYSPPVELAKVRLEQTRARNFEEGGMIYKDRLPAVVGHTYLLRAVSFKEADVLVAFKVHRRDGDGSLIIFWKLLERFATPVLNQEETASSTSIVQTGETAATDPVLKGKIEAALKAKGFQDLIVDTSTSPMTLRGTYPKTKLAEVMSTVMEANGGKPVQNQASGK